MWKWFNCYLSGRHSFSVACEPGTIFLKCVHCGRRSPGWAVDRRGEVSKSKTSPAPPAPAVATATAAPQAS